MAYQRGYQIAVIIAHHADLLRLLENVVDLVVVAVEDDVRFAGVLDLLEKWPTKLIKNINSINFEKYTMFWKAIPKIAC